MDAAIGGSNSPPGDYGMLLLAKTQFYPSLTKKKAAFFTSNTNATDDPWETRIWCYVKLTALSRRLQNLISFEMEESSGRPPSDRGRGTTSTKRSQTLIMGNNIQGPHMPMNVDETGPELPEPHAVWRGF